MADKEIWKDIESYEGLYQVSNMGRVRSLDRLINGKNGSKTFKSGKILKPHSNHSGYQLVILSVDGYHASFQVHRLVAQAFIPNPKSKPQVNHINADKTDNCSSNLEWCTMSENIRHAFNAGIYKSGEKSPRAKLTIEQVEEIRRDYVPRSRNYGIQNLAKKYNVHIETIKDIINNKRYHDDAYIPPKTNIRKTKLSDCEIKEIRTEYRPYSRKCSSYTLSKKYNVSPSTITNIALQKTHKGK